MARPKKQKDLKTTIETELSSMLDADGEPSEMRMRLLKLGITYLAVQAKLEENEYGGFFADAEPGGVPKRKNGKKPVAGSGEDDPEPDDPSGFLFGGGEEVPDGGDQPPH